MASYKRDENLPPLIKHLTTNPPPSLRHIVIVWQNVGVDLPDFLNATALERYSTSSVVVSVRKSKKNSMNERFRPMLDWDEEIYTRAVMIVDDDVVLRKDALEWGYQEFEKAAEQGEGRLTGFMARDFDGEAGDWSYTLRPKKTYSMVLSNAAWLKKEWLERYWEDSAEMRSLRDYVDEGALVQSSLVLAHELTSTVHSDELRRHSHQLSRLEHHRKPSPAPSTEDTAADHRRRRHVCARLNRRRRGRR